MTFNGILCSILSEFYIAVIDGSQLVQTCKYHAQMCITWIIKDKVKLYTSLQMKAIIVMFSIQGFLCCNFPNKHDC